MSRSPSFKVLSAVKETGMPVEITFSGHAVERFCERVRPGLGALGARLQLQGLAAAGVITTEKPGWTNRTMATLWLVAGDVAFPLVPARHDRAELCATSCFARGMSGHAALAA